VETENQRLSNLLGRAPLGGAATFPGQSAVLQVSRSDGSQASLTAAPNLTSDGKGVELQLDTVSHHRRKNRSQSFAEQRVFSC
jgi:hypothetical protein